MKVTLKAARITNNLSREDAAQKIGISVDTLSNYERGLTYPDVPILKKIEEVYGVDYDELIFLPKKNALSVNSD